MDGWKSNTRKYLEDIDKASRYIDSTLFRPPYGRITPFQVRQLMAPRYKMNVIMWTVLSGDFDNDITPEQCLENILLKSESGSILVFHDSDKAFDRMSYALPKLLNYFSKKGFTFQDNSCCHIKKWARVETLARF
jgi:hypothetical protein